MKKLILLPVLLFFFVACDSKREGIIDGQKLINKRLTGLGDSLQHVSDSASIHRIKEEILVEELRFDSLNKELDKLKK
ncbi:MAG: hypothetical protein JO072_06605 [Parafilimonas sp.]|nr:hypothetical protein [Parafilimonas sp.]